MATDEPKITVFPGAKSNGGKFRGKSFVYLGLPRQVVLFFGNFGARLMSITVRQLENAVAFTTGYFRNTNRNF